MKGKRIECIGNVGFRIEFVESFVRGNMKLITEEITKTIPKLYEQESKGPDAIVSVQILRSLF